MRPEELAGRAQDRVPPALLIPEEEKRGKIIADMKTAGSQSEDEKTANRRIRQQKHRVEKKEAARKRREANRANAALKSILTPQPEQRKVPIKSKKSKSWDCVEEWPNNQPS